MKFLFICLQTEQLTSQLQSYQERKIKQIQKYTEKQINYIWLAIIMKNNNNNCNDNKNQMYN
jgi:hypothetical protein